MATDPIHDVGPEVAALFAAARTVEPAPEDTALFAAMADTAASGRLIPQTPQTRRKTVIGKLLTAKAAAAAGALLLSGGAAAAATGSLPAPVQDAASDAVGVVGVEIPKSNHGSKVSTVARDKSNDGEENHGKTVSETARDNHGQNKKNATTTTTLVDDDDEVSNTGPGNSRGSGKSEDSKASDNSRGRGGQQPGDDDVDDVDDVDDTDDDDVDDIEVEDDADEGGGDDRGRGGKPKSPKN